MNDNQKYDDLIKELRTLPKPEFERTTQDEIHNHLFKMSSKYEKKKASSFFIKRLTIGVASVVTLAIFMIFVADFSPEDRATEESDQTLTEIVEPPEFEELQDVFEQALKDLAPDSRLRPIKTEQELLKYVALYTYNFIQHFEVEDLVYGFNQRDVVRIKNMAEQIFVHSETELVDNFNLLLEELISQKKSFDRSLAPFIVEAETFTSVNVVEVERRKNGLQPHDDQRVTEIANIIELTEHLYSAFQEIPQHEKGRLEAAGFDEDYYYYLTAMSVQSAFGFIKVTGEKIEKDVANLMEVADQIVELQLERQNFNTREYEDKMENLIEEIRILTKELYEYTRR